MALNETGLSSILSALAPTLTGDISSLITLAKAAGIIFIIYLVIVIVQAILRIRFAYNIRKIAKSVEDINKKLDKMIKKKE